MINSVSNCTGNFVSNCTGNFAGRMPALHSLISKTMEISLFDSISRQISINAITGYQRYISPHKGFRCAHRVLHGGESCSQYVKREITENGLKMAFFHAKKRFKDCKKANQILREMRLFRQNQLSMETPELPEETEVQEVEENLPVPVEKPAKSSSFNEKDCTNCADLGCSSVDILSDCSALDCSALDCSALDCSALDCSALDCSILDCGGCSF